MKKYSKPEIQVININCEQLMASSDVSNQFTSSDIGISDDDMFSPGSIWD